MTIIPLWAQLLILVVLILSSAFFSMTETALMAVNRYRLRHLARRGNKQAITTLWLLERVEKLLAVILIATTLLNALTTALITVMAISTFGNNESVIIIITITIVLLLIVFAEVSPKIIGATYPERIALSTSFVLKNLMKVGLPAAWFVHLFVGKVLKVLRIKTGSSGQDMRLSPEELRSMILESGNFIPPKHKSILLNLFDLESISVEDVMVPRSQIEALNFSASTEEMLRQLANCSHNKLPVYEGEINRIIGILPVRRAIALLGAENVGENEQRNKQGNKQQDELVTQHFRQRLRKLLTPPYFIPEDTDVFTQLQYFQEKRERLGIIIDEYGEVQGLVTLDDIIEEMIGEFTTSMPGDGDAHVDTFQWDSQGECMLDGTTTLRDINKRLGLDFPIDGPKTLNGLLLEVLQDIPDAPVSLKIKDCVIEIIQVQHQAIKIAKIVQSKNSS